MADERQRVKLRGNLENTASSVWIEGDGRLVIEFYDFSAEAHNAFGNDVAYQMTVSPGDVARVASLLGRSPPEAERPGGPLLEKIKDRFSSYFELRTWLDENAIPYAQAFDSWA